MSRQENPRTALARRLQEILFSGAVGGRDPRIGAEVELLALDQQSRAVVPLRKRLIPFVQSHAASQRWVEQTSLKGAPRFVLPSGGAVTFEPGGQIEYATPPYATPRALLANLRAVVPALIESAQDAGILLLAAGIDPVNGIEDVPLQVDSDRYRSMDSYFATIGHAGARMMRQTASIQINVDAAGDPLVAWRMLNAAAPHLTAMFANSATYAGVSTGEASRRARMWRLLDPTRTGVLPGQRDPAEEYADFALAAPVISPRSDGGTYLPLAEWLEGRDADSALVDEHLTTLFPEVRPKGYFEVRSIDALPPEWFAAPILLLAGIVMDETATQQAADLLGSPDPFLLSCAGATGLRAPDLADKATRLVDVALAACERQGAEFCSEHDLEEASAFFERYTRRGSSPADSTLSR